MSQHPLHWNIRAYLKISCAIAHELFYFPSFFTIILNITFLEVSILVSWIFTMFTIVLSKKLWISLSFKWKTPNYFCIEHSAVPTHLARAGRVSLPSGAGQHGRIQTDTRRCQNVTFVWRLAAWWLVIVQKGLKISMRLDLASSDVFECDKFGSGREF